MNSAKKSRPSKRVIVTGDDDSTGANPVAKIVKIEEEEPLQDQSSNVVEPQQRVLKLEEMFQRACRAARTAELRAEAAEERLGIKESFQSEKKRADELARENESLKRGMVNMRKEHQEKVSMLTTQRDEDRQRARERQINDKASIDSLKHQLAQFEKAAAVAARPPYTRRGLEIHQITDPTNILQLCSRNSSEVTPFETANSMIESACEVYDKYDQKGWLPELLHGKSLSFECVACQGSFNQANIIRHFLGANHVKKVRALGAAVSTAALEYWLDILKPDPDVLAMLQQKKDAAAAAAARRKAEMDMEFNKWGPDGWNDFLPPRRRVQPAQQPQPVAAAAAATPKSIEAPEGIKKAETTD